MEWVSWEPFFGQLKRTNLSPFTKDFRGLTVHKKPLFFNTNPLRVLFHTPYLDLLTTWLHTAHVTLLMSTVYPTLFCSPSYNDPPLDTDLLTQKSTHLLFPWFQGSIIRMIDRPRKLESMNHTHPEEVFRDSMKLCPSVRFWWWWFMKDYWYDRWRGSFVSRRVHELMDAWVHLWKRMMNWVVSCKF